MAPSSTSTKPKSGSKFSGCSFEFTKNGTNVVEHHLVKELKNQPWKALMTPDKAASGVIATKSKGGVMYAEQGSRGGF
ncbi:hypothetical protein PoHVEF18_005052 [Penicillium ochrochloron]